ncbi:MAG: hypothetical protein H6Q00_3157 [Holophagaceae bacterium]|nr:hypothetical protein [Holophagaceae bacterium]
MKRLSPGGQKVLKSVHLVCSGVWLSSVLMLLLLPLLQAPATSDEGLRMFIRVYHFIDLKVLTPAAVLTLLTGLAYSLFTNWGFAKHGWIVFKWVVTLVIVLWGTFHLGPAVESLLAWSGQGHLAMAQQPVFLHAMRLGTVAAIINLTGLVLACVLSVYKPWKNIR